MLDYRELPVMTAEELFSFTKQQTRLRNIKRIVQIDDTRYRILYQEVIERFAELVQLMPASQAHHHAVPGGLFIHTLEVMELRSPCVSNTNYRCWKHRKYRKHSDISGPTPFLLPRSCTTRASA